MTFSEQLTKQRLNLIVSLPANSEELVQAATEGGAEVLKVHMNVDHRASGNSFGGLEENCVIFQRLVSGFDGPVGIVPGDSPEKIKEDELSTLSDMGFQFLSLYAGAAPAWLESSEKLEKMIAFSNNFTHEDAVSFTDSSADVLEASIMSPGLYGTPLTVDDLYKYKSLKRTVKQPIVVPTQKKIEVKELKSLYDIGIDGLMIGAVVTGKSPEKMYEKTREFKQEILSLRK